MRRQVSVVGDDFDADLLAYEKSAVDFIENKIGRSILYSDIMPISRHFIRSVLHFAPYIRLIRSIIRMAKMKIFCYHQKIIAFEGEKVPKY